MRSQLCAYNLKSGELLFESMHDLTNSFFKIPKQSHTKFIRWCNETPENVTMHVFIFAVLANTHVWTLPLPCGNLQSTKNMYLYLYLLLPFFFRWFAEQTLLHKKAQLHRRKTEEEEAINNGNCGSHVNHIIKLVNYGFTFFFLFLFLALLFFVVLIIVVRFHLSVCMRSLCVADFVVGMSVRIVFFSVWLYLFACATLIFIIALPHRKLLYK